MLRYKTETRPGLVTLYDIPTSGQEMEPVNSYNPGARTGPFIRGRSLIETETSTK